MTRQQRIQNLRASINAMQATLRELQEEERVEKRSCIKCSDGLQHMVCWYTPKAKPTP